MATSAGRRALGQRAGGLLLQLALEVAGVLGHPDDHVGDHRDGHEAPTTVSRPSCWRWGSSLSTIRSTTATATHSATASADAHPHRAQRVGPPLAAQEGGDDAHDQRGLEALAEGDHERRQHANPPGRSWLGGPNCA